jgi:hypothetical protein
MTEKARFLSSLNGKGSKNRGISKNRRAEADRFDRFAVFGEWSSEADRRGDAGPSTTTCISPVLTGGTGCAADDR